MRKIFTVLLLLAPLFTECVLGQFKLFSFGNVLKEMPPPPDERDNQSQESGQITDPFLDMSVQPK